MKRLYTLMLSGLVLAASATVAVPTARIKMAKVLNDSKEFFEQRADKQGLRQISPTQKVISGEIAATPTAKASFCFSGKMSETDLKTVKLQKYQATAPNAAAASTRMLKAARKAPSTIADYSAVYDFAASWLLTTGSAPATVTVTVTDETTGAAQISLSGQFALEATFDLTAGTLTVPNKQLLGQDSDGDIYFYVKGADSAGNILDGATDAAATVGTINGSLITFPPMDIWAIGDFNNEDPGWYFLSYNNRMSIQEPEDPNKDPNEGWTSLGEATFQDGWLLPGLGIDQTNRENWYKVELQQNDENKAVYRLVNPYKGNFPLANINECTKNGYIQFDVTDPDHVVFANVEAGFTFTVAGITEFYANNYLSYFVNGGYSVETVIEELGDQIPYTTFKDGVLSLGFTTSAEGDVQYDAGFGTQNSKNGHSRWTDDNDQPLNMSAAVYFPGAKLPEEPSEPVEPEFSVYANGEVNKDLVLNSWWNATLDTQAANPDGTEGKVFSMTHAGTLDGNFCAGFQTPAQGTSAVTGPLHSATLTFKYYATTPCTITVRLSAGKEENKAITVSETDVNKWLTTSFKVADDFKDVSSAWKDWASKGTNDCVFGVVVEQFGADTKVYFNDVNYTDCDTKWEEPKVEPTVYPIPPVPTHDAADVFSLFSGTYRPSMGYITNAWGSGTQYTADVAENGKPVIMMANFSYYGWELMQHIDVTSMEYLHVDFYPAASTSFGFTPISPAKEGETAAHEKLFIVAADTVKVGEWNSIDVPLTYFEGVDFADLFQVKFAEGNGSTVYMANVYFYKQGTVPPTPERDVTGDYSGTFGDFYFRGGIGYFEDDVHIAQDGTTVTLTSDALYTPVTGTLDPATGAISFANEAVGSVTIEGSNYYVRFEPMHYEAPETEDGDGQIVFSSFSATYSPETREISFPADHGFSWIAYSDEAMTAKAGTLEMFDVVKLTWIDPSIDPNEGWTSLGQATFQDGWVLPAFGIDQTDRENWYKVELQQNDANENVYRLVDPYQGDCPVASTNESTKTGYIQFDVTDPDHVVFATDVKAGFASNSVLGIRYLYCYNGLAYFMNAKDLSVDEAVAALSQGIPGYKFSTYKDGIVTLPSWVDEEGDVMSESCFGISLTPGYYGWQDETKNSLNMETKIFFPGADSIREVNAASEAAPEVYYNLHGQRIAKPTVPGLYIRNNTKVVVR